MLANGSELNEESKRLQRQKKIQYNKMRLRKNKTKEIRFFYKEAKNRERILQETNLLKK